jgi:predicted TIM-barrel enzyme
MGNGQLSREQAASRAAEIAANNAAGRDIVERARAETTAGALPVGIAQEFADAVTAADAAVTTAQQTLDELIAQRRGATANAARGGR